MKEYPYILTTGSRYIAYFHTEGRQIPGLRKLVPEPEMEVHPDTASLLGLKDGDYAWVEIPQVPGERAMFRVKLTTGIDPRVIHLAHGWWFPEKPAPEHGCFDSNINVAFSGNHPREEICGSVNTRSTLCKVYRTV